MLNVMSSDGKSDGARESRFHEERMSIDSAGRSGRKTCLRKKRPPFQLANSAWGAVILAALLSSITGCQTSQFTNLTDPKGAGRPDPIVLREGDSVRISFRGAPNLNTVQQIKRDGRIALQLVGEVQAAGLTANQLEKELLKLYGPQLQTKEVTVGVESSSFPIYVTGAVLRPG